MTSLAEYRDAMIATANSPAMLTATAAQAPLSYTATFKGYDLHTFKRPVMKPVLTVGVVQDLVARYFGIRTAEMTSARRSRDVARPRQIAMYLARQFTPQSLPQIGARFGNRDHTTVLHALRKIAALKKTDAQLAVDLDRLTTRLEALA